MNWEEQIQLWNQANITIVDIRYKMLWEGQDMVSYQLPSNVFLFMISGNAYVRIDGQRSYLKRHHLLHAGKGMTMDILPAKNETSLYLIYYKAIVPSLPSGLSTGENDDSMGSLGAFYHVILAEAGLLHNHIRRMYEEWQDAGILSQLRMKSMLFDFVHQLFSMQLHTKEQGNSSDIVVQALRYIHDHYNETIGMNELAELLGCSTSYMYRLFKAEVGKSPNDYMIGLRMKQAQQYLLDTELSLREIAQSVGYVDVYYFSRLYKKYFGISPVQYRKLESGKLDIMMESTDDPVDNLTEGIEVNPLNTSLSSIVTELSHLYNNNENHYQIEGEISLNFSKLSRSSMTAMVILCLSLLLSACQTGSSNAGSSNIASTENKTTTTEVEKTAEAPATTRIYEHKYGKSEIPTQPKRVVTAYHLGHMLALGERPLGSATYILQYSANAMDTSGIEDLGAPLSLEKIAALEPDLIILIEAYLEPSGGYDAFNQIAPTVVVEVNQDPVKDIRIIGDLLNKKGEAEQWIVQYNEKIAETKERVQAKFGSDETFTILNVRSESSRMIYRDRNMGGNILYTYWGMKPQQKVLTDVIEGIKDESSYLDISAEVIPEYMGDHLILATDAEAESSVKQLMNSELWKQLGPVKNNQVYRIDFDQFLFNDPISAMKQVEILADTLTKESK